jgi:hypothetical protein
MKFLKAFVYQRRNARSPGRLQIFLFLFLYITILTQSTGSQQTYSRMFGLGKVVPVNTSDKRISSLIFTKQAPLFRSGDHLISTLLRVQQEERYVDNRTQKSSKSPISKLQKRFYFNYSARPNDEIEAVITDSSMDLRASNTCPDSGNTISQFTGSIIGKNFGSKSLSTCTWIIAPPNATNLVLKFESFHLETCCSFLEIYECFDVSCISKSRITEPLSGDVIPAPVYSGTGRMQLILTSIFSSESNVFQAYYETLCPSNTFGQIKVGLQDCRPCRSSCIAGKQLTSSCTVGSLTDTATCSCPAGLFSNTTLQPCIQCSVQCSSGDNLSP